MPNTERLATVVAENKVRCDRNDRDIRDVVKEIRALPDQIKSAIKSEFSSHSLIHKNIDDQDKLHTSLIDDLLNRLIKIEILIIKIKANWKIIAAGFSCVVAVLVWVFQHGVAALIAKL